MKVIKNKPEIPVRKLMALVSPQGGVYFNHHCGGSKYLGVGAIAGQLCTSLETLASKDHTLARVYEGESITITF